MRLRLRENRLARGLQLWHLLSLDAPTVAMLWTWFLARSNYLTLPRTAVLAMGVAVWMLYAVDRLLDARCIEPKTALTPKSITLSGAKNPGISPAARAPRFAQFEPRHYFHHQYRRTFRLGILIASIVLSLLLPEIAPQSIRLYLVIGALLFGYFILIHLSAKNARRLPKELAVGVFFSAALFVPTVARNPELRLVLLPAAVLFAFVCSLNCVFIYAWEHPDNSHDAHFATLLAIRFLAWLAATAALAGVLLAAFDRCLPWPIPVACAIAASLLLLLHRNRSRFSPTTLRGAADLCLLTPVLLLPLIRR